MSGISSDNVLAEADRYDEYVASSRPHPAPLVSVLMITYNHADYIAEAIEGVLSQRCDFPIELIIGEDASSDGTLAVAREYQARHPELIRLVASRCNVGFQENIRRVFGLARGRYIAWCEGDDYWCAPDKLAQQARLLEADHRIGVVHTDWVRTRQANGGWSVHWDRPVHRNVPHQLLQGDLFRTFHYPRILRTCTRMARREAVQACFDSELCRRRYSFFDAVLAAYLTSRWRVGYVPAVTAVYRESARSILRSGVQARIRFLQSSLEFDTDARAFFGDRPDYPEAYRWELDMGLLLWALRARDFASAYGAVRDLGRYFPGPDFIRASVETLRIRCARWKRSGGGGMPPPSSDA